MFTYILMGVIASYFFVLIYAGIEKFFEKYNDKIDETESAEE